MSDSLDYQLGVLQNKLVKKTAEIHEKDIRLTELENALWRIANPVSAMHADAEKDGCKLNGHVAAEMAKNAGMLSGWARSALADFSPQPTNKDKG